MAKRIIALLLAAGITVTLAACGGSGTTDVSSVDTDTVESIVESEVASEDTATESEETKSEETKSEEQTSSVASQAASSKTETTSSKTQSTADRFQAGNNNQTANGAGATNQSGKDNLDAAVDLKGLKIKDGKSILDGLDFKGKTFTMAITEEGQYHTESFKRTVAAFEKEYNCKIKYIEFTFADYNKQVSQKLAAGAAPDICFVHGVNFPACAIDGMYEPLTKHISKADVMKSNDPKHHGIDLNKTSYFVYENEIYGTCNFSSCFPYVIYYNKKQMSDNGLTDPRLMAEKSNKWTWDYIKGMGRRFTKGDVYFLSNSFTGRGLPLAFGAPVTTVKNGVVKENVTSTGYMEAMKFMQSITYGSTAITEPRDSAHAYNSYDTLLKGGVFLWTEETSKYLDISKELKTSTAFGRNPDNLEITTMPLGSTNKQKAYPTGWLTAVACGKGRDPRVAIAWDVFRSDYKDPVGRGSNEMNDEDQKFVDGLLEGNICCEIGCFGTSDMTTMTLTEGGIIQKITKGADVTQSVTSIKGQMEACIKATMKK